jgi:hypothetical protein
MSPVTYSSLTAPLKSSTTVDLRVKDTASTTYGIMDGYSLCGARTYTQTYYMASDTSNPISTPVFATFSGYTLTLAPTLSSQLGNYVLKTKVCLVDPSTKCYET